MECEEKRLKSVVEQVMDEMLHAEPEQPAYCRDSGLPDSGWRSEFATGAVRDASEGKGIPSEIYPDFIRRLSVLLEKGANKYSRGNWRKGIPLSRYVDSMQRHMLSAAEGDWSEDHLAAVAFNVMGFMYTYDAILDDALPESLNDLPFYGES